MTLSETEKRKLAEEVKLWRARATSAAAAKVLGISLRTLHGIEQGRGFNYPTLLRQAMNTLEVPQPEEGQDDLHSRDDAAGRPRETDRVDGS